MGDVVAGELLKERGVLLQGVDRARRLFDPVAGDDLPTILQHSLALR